MQKIMNVPLPPAPPRMHTRFTDPQNRWYCYEIDRYGNNCHYRRDDVENKIISFAPPGRGRRTYFQWSSINAGNGAYAPFRYRYWIKDETDNQLLVYNESSDTQTGTYYLPINHHVQLTLQTVDRIGTASSKGIFDYVIR